MLIRRTTRHGISRAVLASLMVLAGVADGFAAPRFGNFFAPENGAEYRLALEPGHLGSPGILDQQIEGNFQVAGDPARVWTVQGNASLFNLSQPVAIPGSTVVFPESLGGVETGFSYLDRTGGRSQWGTKFSIGSVSDHLFNSLYETEVQLTGSWMVPSRESDAWIFLLSYSNNRSFLNNIPLPGVEYLWNLPAQGLRIMAGFPILSLEYQPNPDWTAKLLFFGPTNQGLEVGRRLTGKVQAYAAYQRAPQQWMRAGRNDHSNRLIYDEKKTVLGFRSPVGGRFSMDLSGGRTFDRRLFESRDATHTGAPRANLSNGWIVNLALTFL